MRICKKLLSIFLVVQVLVGAFPALIVINATKISMAEDVSTVEKAYDTSSEKSCPKVSVIIPVYNTAEFLPKCLDSVVGQTLQNIEIICIDDGSTDNSLEILREYEQKDSRVKVITKPNQGCWTARNAGLEIATGEYVAFVDSDDYLELDAYETAYNAANAHDIDILYFGYYKDEKPRKYPAKIVAVQSNTDFRKFHRFVFVWNRLYKNSMLKESGVKFENMTILEDFCFDYMVLPWAKKLESINNIFYHYNRENMSSVTHVTKNKERSFKLFPLIAQAWREKNYFQGNEVFLLSTFLRLTRKLASPFTEENAEVYKLHAKEILDSFGSDIYNEKNIAKLDKFHLRTLRKLEEFARDEEKSKSAAHKAALF